MDDETKVFDIEAVMERLEGDHELYQDVVQLFFEGFEETITKLSAAVASKDHLALGMAAHATKGALGNIGAMRSWAKAYELEKAGKNGVFESADQLIKELQVEVAAFSDAFNSYKEKLRPN